MTVEVETMVKLRHGWQMLWRCEGESQVGLSPRLVLHDLSLAEQQLLDMLERDRSPTDLHRSSRRLGVSQKRLRELLATLTEYDLLEDVGTEPALLRAGLGADVELWARRRLDGTDLVSARSQAVVAIIGLDGLGATLVPALAGAGVGTLLLADERPIARTEVGPATFRLSDVGQPRADVLRTVLHHDFPHVATSARPRTRPDLVVLVEQDISDPLRQRPLMREDIAHLFVVVREQDVLIGPLVRPGVTTCGRCVELHRRDADPRWPAIATQLLGTTPRGVESSLALQGAGAALGEALAHLDGRAVTSEGASLRIDPDRALPEVLAWSLHAECGCTALPQETAAQPGSGAAPPPQAA